MIIRSCLISTILVPFCRQYLHEHQPTPFSVIRDWMHGFTHVVKNTIRPSTISWNGNVLTTPKGDIDFETYKLWIHSEVASLESLMEKQVLMGLFTLDDFDSHIASIEDKWDEKTLGHGIIIDEGNEGLDTVLSDCFFKALYKAKKLGVSLDPQGVIRYDKRQAKRYLEFVDQAWELVIVLIHTAGQAGPGRGVEEGLYHLKNTKHTRRHLFYEKSLRTGGLNSNYHKGAIHSGAYKNIFRLLPYQLFRILWVLIQITRPLELTLLLEYVISEEKRTQVTHWYSERVFASGGNQWTSQRLSARLAKWFKYGKLGVEMGIRPYRHFSVAIQRKYLDYGVEEEKPKPTDLIQASNLIFGHKKETADFNYAIEKGSGSTLANMKVAFLKVGLAAHALIGLPTSGPAVKDIKHSQFII